MITPPLLGQGDIYSHCRGDWQIAFTKQNFSDSLFFYPPIQNSEFKIHNCSPAKVERRLSEGWAKESRRAGAAEYVTKDKLAPKEN